MKLLHTIVVQCMMSGGVTGFRDDFVNVTQLCQGPQGRLFAAFKVKNGPCSKNDGFSAGAGMVSRRQLRSLRINVTGGRGRPTHVMPTPTSYF